jgi:hypothetical protein
MKIQSHALLIGFVAVSFLALLHLAAQAQAERPVEQWGIFEISLKGPTAGNPFKNVTLDAIFAQGKETVKVKGFYDGGGTYRIRFMPEKTGTWSYKTKSNIPQLNGKTGAFDAVKPSTGNRGPVRVRNTFHFGYADGTPYFQIGTTSYAWTHQGDELEEQTLATLKVSPFNKMRMCIFPKHYAYNANEPIFYPFLINPDGKFDLERFDPAFFRHLEKRVGDLRDLGIEADLILFHPYDRWGFSVMEKETDDRYLRYVIARLSAYRNVWWSLANEYDFMNAGRNELADLRKRGLSIRVKQSRDWDRFFEILQNEDPHKHLRSIHNGFKLYNHTKPWATHASIQNGSAVTDPGRAIILRDAYEKPIVYDEVKYEGNISQRWGNISAEEMVYRFWQGTIAGTYVGHSETYMHPKDIIWWSKGGVLHGQSPPRIAFLRKVLEDGPPEGMEPIDKWQDKMIAGKKGEYYLIYFGKEKPTTWEFELPKASVNFPAGTKFTIDVLDTWNMTTTPVGRSFGIRQRDNYTYISDDPAVVLPGRPFIALRVQRSN